MQQTDIQIQDASNRDIHEMTKLLRQLFAVEADFSFDAEKHSKGLRMMIGGCRRHKTVKVACYQGRIVGMCTAQTRISTAQGGQAAIVEDLVVDEEFKGQKIGTALVLAIYDWAAKRGIQHLQLLADQDNTTGLSFYNKLGWERTHLICLTKRQ